MEPEVDFVLTIGFKRIPIEVKYKRGRLIADDCKGIQSFCGKKHYDASFGLLITQNQTAKIDDDVVSVPASALILLR